MQKNLILKQERKHIHPLLCHFVVLGLNMKQMEMIFSMSVLTEPEKYGKLSYENKAEHGSVLTGSRFGCSQVNTKGSLGGLPLAVVCPGRDIVMVIERRRIPSALSF